MLKTTSPRNALRCLALALACAAALAQPAAARSADLSEPIVYQQAQDYMLQLINAERARAGAAPVRSDPLAAQAGKQHADDMCAGAYISHWDREGLKPARRFNLLGGYHMLSENVYMGSGYNDSTNGMIERAMETLMASPGHRKTILDPRYTHVGIGLALSPDGRRFYVSQEFITRVGGEYSCPTTAAVGSKVDFCGRFDASCYSFEQIAEAWEEGPVARDPRWLNRTGVYQDGDRMFAAYSPLPSVYFSGMSTMHDVAVDEQQGTFKCRALLDFKGKPGLYYLFVWLRDKRSGEMVQVATATIEVTR